MGAALGYVAQKQPPLWDLLLFTLISNTSIVNMNLNLMLNSVGFYHGSHVLRSPVLFSDL
ncbi:hypothetical protein KC19_9G125800 [Ceratodon purpureus]|uniref:Uncharacterized protein n=1 Tax=Ceratodon purpureus TaxID=3225 RepID=A0A8T0GUF7_CERPU|nr:hypothetical protein KC19_9G125800 [Ceratodon purpureus]